MRVSCYNESIKSSTKQRYPDISQKENAKDAAT